MYLYVSTRVFRLIWRVLDVLKGLGAGAHQRGRLGAQKNDVLGFWKIVCMHMVGVCTWLGHAHACMIHAYACIPKNLNLTALMSLLQMIITYSI